jgi:dTDP-4-dehydrorhamnose reductase
MSGWLVAGSGGMLGTELVAALRLEGESVIGLTRRELDITDRGAVDATIHEYEPEVVVNCAAWTAVDEAEAHEDKALQVNGRGPAHLAAACNARGTHLIHISTDYVFSGDSRDPYTEKDAPSPLNAYGRTKLAGERAVLGLLPETGYVVRTAWLYGAHGPNFVRTMMRLEQERAQVNVVADQRGQPTWTASVADRIIALIRSQAPAGIYHATSSGHTTWFGLAREVFRLLGADPNRVRPTTTDEYPRAAGRPAYSVLGHEALESAGIDSIGDWDQVLQAAFPALTGAEGLSSAAWDPNAHMRGQPGSRRGIEDRVKPKLRSH